MDLIETAAPARRRPGRATAVAVALAAVAAGQAFAVTRTPPLPPGVTLDVPLEAYAFSRDADGDAVVTFQLRNAGRAVRVLGLGADVPGLRLVGRAVAGEPVAFRNVDAAGGALPEFDLAPGVAAVVSLTYRAGDCARVPRDPTPVPVALAVGRARGGVGVVLPGLPDDGALAEPQDLVPWQRVLARAVCG